MALIQDPDDLNQATEVTFDTTAKTIQLSVAGNLSTDGVTLQALYSFTKEEWKNDTNLIKYPFPFVPITNEQFEFVNGWTPADTTTIELIRSAGFAVKNTDGSSAEEYAGIITLGTIGAGDQVYYLQDGGAPENVVLTGAVNQAVKVYGDASNGNFDYRDQMDLFVREQAKTYADASLTDIGVTTMTYQAYRFPLANQDDLKVTENDTTADAYDVDITYLDGSGFTAWANSTLYAANAVVSDGGRWYITAAGGTSSGTGVADDTGVTDWTAYSGERLIGSTYYAFDVIIDADASGNGGEHSAEEIYMNVQSALRKTTDIDAGTGTVRGDTADALLAFVGDTLVTSTGVFIDNFQALDINRLEFYDTSGTKRTFPFVAAGTIAFNANLVSDGSAIYRMYYTSGFGTAGATLVNDASDNPISGTITSGSISFTYDYDGEGGVDQDVTVVAIGLGTAQYVLATSTLTRSIQNSISLVSSLERNYSNN